MPPLLMTIKERLSPTWKAASSYLQRGQHWLTAPREPIAWKALLAKAAFLRLPKTNASRILTTATIAALLAVVIPPAWRWYFTEVVSKDGTPVYPHAALVNPAVAGVGAALLIGAALQQAATARRRHKEQTDADRQRRITESYGKAVEQLAHDKIEVRLGGIYTLERISRESTDDHWPVIEMLCAFVREKARWKAPAEAQPEEEEKQPDNRAGPSTDIMAVIGVIRRRSIAGRNREGHRLDLSGVDLRGVDLTDIYFRDATLVGAHFEAANIVGTDFEHANLRNAHLENALGVGIAFARADLRNAHLKGAGLMGAHFEHAHLQGAHLDGAILSGARFDGADLRNAYIEDVSLAGVHFERADLRDAHFKGTTFGPRLLHIILKGSVRILRGGVLVDAAPEDSFFDGVHFEGADLRGAKEVSEEELEQAFADADTRLPEYIVRPAGWPPARPDPGAPQEGHLPEADD